MARPTKRTNERVQLIDDVLHDILLCYVQLFEKDTHLIESYTAKDREELAHALDIFCEELALHGKESGGAGSTGVSGQKSE